MQHPDEGTIHSWLDGALTEQESAEIEAHVQNCAQCAAAVAEARGFIAGASRILTALDNVPSGVVPASNRGKSKNWPVWRAAAAIVVVALGSFVVLRDRVRSVDDSASQSAAVLTAPQEPQAQVKTAAEPPQAERGVTSRGAAVGSVDNSRTSGEQKSAASNIGENAPSAPVARGATTRESTRFSDANVVAMDAAAATVLPRDVGRRRAVGASSTLYEVSPGDTVVLTEAIDVQLESAVVTSAATANRQPIVMRGSSGLAKSAAADTQPTVSATQRNTQPAAQPTAQSATPPIAPIAPTSAPALRTTAGMANPYNTITWVDSTTGKRMSLSGRHSVRELEAIRQKIERVRAAAPTEKKRP